MGLFLRYKEGSKNSRSDSTSRIEAILSHRVLSVPIFLGVIFLMFYLTFVLGNYPVTLIEQLFLQAEKAVNSISGQGFLHDMVINGIIPGIGGVAAFLPNIIILFTLIAVLEDSGYMARSAKIVEGLMTKMGLSDKSFIPLVIGMGCNVPAILATRNIPDEKKRLVTMLIIPFMSCSARLPVYVLFISAFFSSYRSLILFALYSIGIVIGLISATIFSRIVKQEPQKVIQFDMPSLRLPSFRSVILNMWNKSIYFIKKMGGVILVASVIIWALGYLPVERESNKDQANTLTGQYSGQDDHRSADYRKSYIGIIGEGLLPVFEPLGFDWEMSVGIITGLPAKEIIVSTLAVLYNQDRDSDPSTEPASLWNFNSNLPYPGLSAFSFMLFVLISFPCIGTLISIRRESGKVSWMIISFLYNTTVAWLISFTVYQAGSLIIRAGMQ